MMFKVATERRDILEAAVQLGSVAEACRRAGISRSTFYEWRRRHAARGIVGLRPRSTAPARRPTRVSRETAWKVNFLALRHPSWGCARIARHLNEAGHAVSSTTVHGILARLGLSHRRKRFRRAERELVPARLSIRERDQIEELAAFNPNILETHYWMGVPGTEVAVDHVRLDGGGDTQYHLLLAVDLATSFAWLRLAGGALGEVVSSFLADDVAPELAGWDPPWAAIHHPRREPYTQEEVVRALRAANLHRRLPPSRQRRRHGFVARVLRDLRAQVGVVTSPADDAEAASLASRLAAWVHSRNDSALEGFPNFGRSPLAELMRAGLRP